MLGLIVDLYYSACRPDYRKRPTRIVQVLLQLDGRRAEELERMKFNLSIHSVERTIKASLSEVVRYFLLLWFVRTVGVTRLHADDWLEM